MPRDHYPNHRRHVGDTECVLCGQNVRLIEESTEWEWRNGRWVTTAYGPGEGVCCDRLYVNDWDGCRYYKLEPTGMF